MHDDFEEGNYEVGYKKPPKRGQFRVGVSGNPSGRPKKATDLNSELMRELMSDLVVNENGKRKVIKKSQGLIKQLTNKGLSGNVPALREVLARWQQALENSAEEEQHAQYLANRTVRDMSDEEMWYHIIENLKKTTSPAHMAEMLAEVARILNFDKAQILGLPVSDDNDAATV